MRDAENPELVAASDAVLALLGINEPTHQQQAGALLVAGALVRLTNLRNVL